MKKIYYKAKRIDNGKIVESDSIFYVNPDGSKIELWACWEGWVEVYPETLEWKEATY